MKTSFMPKALAAAATALLLVVSAAQAQDFKVCEVTDTGGVDDKSFNQAAWEGAQRAAADLGGEAKVLESSAETDYVPNVNSLVADKCSIIITVGFLLGDATKAAAEANPDQHFSIVDFAYDPPLKNVLGQVFATQQAAFLAGYAAASVTKTGVIGTFGGINIGGPVTDFMDGFVWGAEYHNKQKGTSVKVLGWNPATKEGLFTGNFSSLSDGRDFAKNLNDEGADIILPVAGPVGLGSAALAAELGPDTLKIVGVDADWYLTDPDHKGIYLTSVLKRVDNTVYEAVKRAHDGALEGGVMVGTLENGGVGLAPFHDFDSVVSAETKAELEAITKGIIDGSIKVGGM